MNRIARPAALFIQRVEQLDNHHLALVWNDGTRHTFLLSQLQSACPCAACACQKPHERRTDAELRARHIRTVGRYGLRIEFCSGCSHGIYSYQLLYSLGEVAKR